MGNRMRVSASLLIATAWVLVVSVSVSAAPVVEHTGDTNPLTEGWSSLFGDGISVGPAGPPASWAITGSANGAGWYTWVPTSQHVADAMADGWALEATVQAAAGGDTGSAALWFAIPGIDRYVLNIESDGVTQTVNAVTYAYSWDTGSAFASPAGPHAYRIRYDPQAATADVFVDGVERISNWGGDGYITTGGVNWGVGSGAAVGTGSYSHVAFTILPEPASLTLLLVGGCAALWARRR